MNKKVIAYSSEMKGELDDDYTLYNDGSVLHEYDRNKYPGNYNLKEIVNAHEIKHSAKLRLLDATSTSDKELAKTLLGL